MKQHLRAIALFSALFIYFQTASTQSYDLALRLNSIAGSPVKYETSVPFNITVFNQGTPGMLCSTISVNVNFT